jgi:hypothetical protein
MLLHENMITALASITDQVVCATLLCCVHCSSLTSGIGSSSSKNNGSSSSSATTAAAGESKLVAALQRQLDEAKFQEALAKSDLKQTKSKLVQAERHLNEVTVNFNPLHLLRACHPLCAVVTRSCTCCHRALCCV